MSVLEQNTKEKKEIIIFFCETTGQGQQHTLKELYSNENLVYAKRQFKMWSNCYMVKIRTTDKDGMFSDEIVCKRNIVF